MSSEESRIDESVTKSNPGKAGKKFTGTKDEWKNNRKWQ